MKNREMSRQKVVAELKRWEAALDELKVKAEKAGPEGKAEYKKLIRKLQVGRSEKGGSWKAFRSGHQRI